ncbi:MAG TPA: ABC-F family ATP-binding cassette domain-containing protein [Phycisphaerae bacterium]|nr:ABC-F family ATP-binding cassette domain-containing protein [Phycisphaerae bacterium]
MSLIVGQSVTKSYGTHDVLRNVSFRLSGGARVGLVGANGQGKTTLLRILAGLDPPTEGTVQRSRALRIGYLPQEPPALEATTLHEAMLAVFDDLRRMEADLHDLAGRLAGADERLVARYGRMQHEFDTRGGYTYPHRVEAVLSGLGFSRRQWAQPLAQLSGGQRTRAYLAMLLLEEPDLLLLDEPTNHLDLDSVEWLERWVQSYAGAVVVVSHDRYFLDSTTTQTWEVAFASLETYRGSYTAFLTQRDERYKERMRQWEAQQEHIRATEDFIQRNIAGQRGKEAQGRRTRLERFLKTVAIPKPRKHDRIHLRLAPSQRSGDLVLRARELAAGYERGSPLLAAEQIEVRRTQRIAVVGANGSGKTTLLRTLMGELPTLSGKLEYGARVSFAYLSQTQETLREGATALEAVRSAAPGEVPAQRARTVLGSFLLSGDEVFKRIGQLSGGERTRVVLAQLAVRNANVLLLDEPTNHLDIPSTEVFQEVLQNFPGTIVFVTHDRYLVQAVATHIWAIADGEIKALPGRWADYLRWRSERAGPPGEPEAPPAGPAAPGPAAASDRGGKDYRRMRREKNRIQRLRRRHDELEGEIHKLEGRLAELSATVSAAGEAGDLEKVQSLGIEYQQTESRLKSSLAEWEQIGVELESA